jgi:signal transduction histidine kinase
MLTRRPGAVDASQREWTHLRLADARGGHDAAMTIGSSLFLIAVGAILKFAVTAHVAGVDLQVVGVILMIVGAVGLVIGLAMMISARDATREPPPPPPPSAY